MLSVGNVIIQSTNTLQRPLKEGPLEQRIEGLMMVWSRDALHVSSVMVRGYTTLGLQKRRHKTWKEEERSSTKTDWLAEESECATGGVENEGHVALKKRADF